MQRESLGGGSMIAGAAMMLVTMAFHPDSGDQPALSVAVHALGLASVPIAFYGTWILTLMLSAGGPLSGLALAFQGMSAVAAIAAATASGLVAPDLISRAAALEGGALEIATGVLRYNHAVNQAFARLLVASSSVAIGIWSLEILRTGLLRRAAGILGCTVAVLTLLALLSGHVTMDVHGFGAIVLAQAVWLILVGAELRSRSTKQPRVD